MTTPQPEYTALVRYDAMCRAIQAAYDIDEVLEIRNKAVALEEYARRARNKEMVRQAAGIRLVYGAEDVKQSGNSSRTHEAMGGSCSVQTFDNQPLKFALLDRLW